jgi:hypothetical protein
MKSSIVLRKAAENMATGKSGCCLALSKALQSTGGDYGAAFKWLDKLKPRSASVYWFGVTVSQSQCLCSRRKEALHNQSTRVLALLFAAEVAASNGD